MYDARTHTQGELSRIFGVSVVQVGRIVRRESWQQVQPAPPSAVDMQAALQRTLRVQEEVNRQNAEKEAIEKRHLLGDALVKELQNEGESATSRMQTAIAATKEKKEE